MLHGRRLVVAVLIAVALVGGAVDALGPFGPHPALAYARFLADFEVGRVDRIVQWRDRLEVREGSESFLVVVPEGADLSGDLAQARLAGGVGISFGRIQDEWIAMYTPWVPALLLVGGLAVWLPAVRRLRPGEGGSAGTPLP